MNRNFEQDLYNNIDQTKIFEKELMSKHTTFRIGGEADYFVVPTEIEEVRTIICLCERHKVPYCVVGNGSNLLVGDLGFRGVIIQIYKGMEQIEVEEDLIVAQAGASLAKIARNALEAELTGFEFAAGIPGTLGGAVRMNAGAYGGEMKDIVKEVLVLTKEGKILKLENQQMDFAYRTSVIEKMGYTILGATLRLQKGKKEEIKAVMDDLREKRVSKQPLEFPSAGSTFKRPEGYFAGKLIQDAGLKGFRVGGAMVSEKHSGFVINVGNAKARDVIELMEQIRQKVEEQFGVVLEPEVRRIGEF